MSLVKLAVGQVVLARDYTQSYVQTIAPEEWFQMPPGGVTHLAWQVGHLAMAQYSLGIRRIRGEQPRDEELIPSDFRALFGRGSRPSPDVDLYPSPAEIRLTFEGVHLAFLELAETLTDATLAEPTDPHPFFDTKLGSLLWCSRHETYHIGQIALLRRLMGYEPRW